MLSDGPATRRRAAEIKKLTVGNTVYLRGLIEFSNICSKDCLYCGIRSSNRSAGRYELTDEEVQTAAEYAWKSGYGSVAIQAGERGSEKYTRRMAGLIAKIKELSAGELGITLSLGEQSYETLKLWRDEGADRYLMRIETSNRKLYESIHPADGNHLFDRRIETLNDLRSLSYQVGTGVMIGLPGQTTEDLADDILFFRDTDIDMCGMGPYLEHHDTPLFNVAKMKGLPTVEERFEMTLNMVAALRCVMPDINIAATTALQAIRPDGREEALRCGANVLMPNITPSREISNYKLYENKPVREGLMGEGDGELFAELESAGFEIGFKEQGNSRHYHKRF